MLSVLIASIAIQIEPAQAYNATVTATLGQSLATVPPLGYGVHTSVYDNNFTPTDLPSKLQTAGVTALRYPGGSYADAFHWQTMSASTGVSEYINPNDTFDHLVTLDAQPAGAGVIITCNYGSNAAGTGGADPNEAAAWVDYSNNTKHYGVKYWEIGNEIPGNGFYGADWETDQHYPSSTNRAGQPALGPTAYGQNVLQFVTAMKAKDPTIKVGVVMCTPGSWPDGVSPDWNTNMLAACGTKIDFVIIHWYPGGTTANALAASSTIAGVVSSLRNLINTYCGPNAPNVEILVTETNAGSSAGDGPQQTLFATDNYLTWFENGAKNVDWLELHSNFLSEGVTGVPDETPGEGFYGAQLASNVARVGDSLCATSSNNSLVGVHVVNRTDNSIGVQIINKDPSNSATVTVNLSNGTFASSGTRHDFGVGNFPSGSIWPSSGMSTSTISGIGATSFTVTVPAYTVSNFIIPKSASAPATPTLPASGANGLVSLSWTASGGATSYNIFRSTTSGGEGSTPYATVSAPATTYADPSVTNGTTYYYKVSAVNTYGQSAQSTEQSATPAAPPAAPSNLTASAVSKSQINLAWTNNATNATGVAVQRSTDNVNFTQIATLAASATTYSSTGLARSTTYYYKVDAYNSGGASAYSNTASATTLRH